MIAHVCDLKASLLFVCIVLTTFKHVLFTQPGDFVHTLGDAHVYLNHIDALQEQVPCLILLYIEINITCCTDCS